VAGSDRPTGGGVAVGQRWVLRGRREGRELAARLSLGMPARIVCGLIFRSLALFYIELARVRRKAHTEKHCFFLQKMEKHCCTKLLRQLSCPK
jgi:hypothetical protein